MASRPSVQWLDPADDVFEDDELDGKNHRNRAALDAVLASPDDEASWAALKSDYDEQAADWTAWVETKAGYFAPLLDGISHANPRGRLLEVGSGSVSALPDLPGVDLISSDISLEMLREHPGRRRICCDVRRLPFPDASVDMIAGLNAVPFCDEFIRVLRPGGHVLWASTFGERTPMYVAPEELAERFPGWSVVARRAGAGEWCRLRKDA